MDFNFSSDHNITNKDTLICHSDTAILTYQPFTFIIIIIIIIKTCISLSSLTNKHVYL